MDKQNTDSREGLRCFCRYHRLGGWVKGRSQMYTLLWLADGREVILVLTSEPRTLVVSGNKMSCFAVNTQTVCICIHMNKRYLLPDPVFQFFHRGHHVSISAGAKEQCSRNDTWIIKSNLQGRGTALCHSDQLSPPLHGSGKHGLYCAWTNWRIRGEINSNTAFINRVLTDREVVHLPRTTDGRRVTRKRVRGGKWSPSETGWPRAARSCSNNRHTLHNSALT